jgi:radical SAM superfamily enzyme YgiQ (UPF0313 family)
MKILLTAINAKYIHSNLAVYSLKAYAKDERVELAEYTINQQKDDILMDIYKKRPDILCFSCYIWNLDYVEEIIREIHKLRPELPVWVGGPEVSYDSVNVLERLPEVTGVMKGEGEETFAALCAAWKDSSDGQGISQEYADISGITYRAETGEIIENPWRPVMDLSKVPFVYQQIDAFEHKIIYYESSRGCPFSCSYCLSSVDKQLRFRDLKLVKQELQFFIDHNVPQVKFVDRTFNCRHEHAMAIWRYIAEHDNGVTNFHFEIAADLLNEEEVTFLETVRPGLFQFEIGVQSTNPKTIQEIRRVMDFEKVGDVVQRIQTAGNIHQHLDLIAGLPYENIDSFARSFDDVYRLKPEQIQLGFLKVLKGSYMETQQENYGLVCKNRPPYEMLYTRWLTYEDVIRLKGIEEMVEVYYNSRQFTHTMEALEKEYTSAFTMYDSLQNYYVTNQWDKVSHKRSARYDILLYYIEEYYPEKTDQYRELLTYDYYLRENAKTRPEFAGEYRVSKEYLRTFYENEAASGKYLPDYQAYDKNQMRRMTHVEYFAERDCYVLFDYQNRNPLSQEARTVTICPCKNVAKSIE